MWVILIRCRPTDVNVSVIAVYGFTSFAAELRFQFRRWHVVSLGNTDEQRCAPFEQSASRFIMACSARRVNGRSVIALYNSRHGGSCFVLGLDSSYAISSYHRGSKHHVAPRVCRHRIVIVHAVQTQRTRTRAHNHAGHISCTHSWHHNAWLGWCTSKSTCFLAGVLPTFPHCCQRLK